MIWKNNGNIYRGLQLETSGFKIRSRPITSISICDVTHSRCIFPDLQHIRAQESFPAKIQF